MRSTKLSRITPKGRIAGRGAFRAWAGENRVTPVPAAPETLALFLAGLADRGYAVPTLRRYLSAIAAAHIAEGLDDPTKAPWPNLGIRLTPPPGCERWKRA